MSAYRATAAEQMLIDKKVTPKLLAEAAAKVTEGIDPLGDIHASAAYRREAAAVYARRALEAAIARAGGKKS